MRVENVLKSNRQSLATCIPEESIATICTRLSALNIGAFPVCDAHGTLVGIISERDVVRAFAKDGARLADMHVRDLMTREVTTCEQETTMVEAERLMHKHRIRHLPVTMEPDAPGNQHICSAKPEVWILDEKVRNEISWPRLIKEANENLSSRGVRSALSGSARQSRNGRRVFDAQSNCGA